MLCGIRDLACRNQFIDLAPHSVVGLFPRLRRDALPFEEVILQCKGSDAEVVEVVRLMEAMRLMESAPQLALKAC